MTASPTRFLRPLLAAAGLCALSLGPALAAPTLAVTGPSTAGPGSSFTVSVSASGIADLYAYQFDVTFNPALFRAGGVSEGPFLAGGGATSFDGGSIDNAAGTVSFVLDTLVGAVPGVSGSGVLATLDFTRLGAQPGTGVFALANVNVLDSALADIVVGTQSLTIAAVPEPAGWALVAGGIGALGACAGRRRKAGAAAA